MKLKAMTYNICSGRNMARERDLEFAASVVRSVAPDFVTLNEVRSRTADIGPIDQANELGRLTGYYRVFGRSIDYAGGEYGNALLSRLPIVEHDVVHIPDPEACDDPRSEHRTVLRSILMAGDRRIRVLCTHFGLLDSEQENAVDTVMRLLEEEDMPTLLMGDLNLSPEAPALAPLFEALTDVCGGRAEPLTFPSDEPECKIDYIFHTAHFETEAAYSMDTQCSDHRPLIAELKLK